MWGPFSYEYPTQVVDTAHVEHTDRGSNLFVGGEYAGRVGIEREVLVHPLRLIGALNTTKPPTNADTGCITGTEGRYTEELYLAAKEEFPDLTDTAWEAMATEATWKCESAAANRFRQAEALAMALTKEPNTMQADDDYGLGHSVYEHLYNTISLVNGHPVLTHNMLPAVRGVLAALAYDTELSAGKDLAGGPVSDVILAVRISWADKKLVRNGCFDVVNYYNEQFAADKFADVDDADDVQLWAELREHHALHWHRTQRKFEIDLADEDAEELCLEPEWLTVKALVAQIQRLKDLKYEYPKPPRDVRMQVKGCEEAEALLREDEEKQTAGGHTYQVTIGEGEQYHVDCAASVDSRLKHLQQPPLDPNRRHYSEVCKIEKLVALVHPPMECLYKGKAFYEDRPPKVKNEYKVQQRKDQKTLRKKKELNPYAHSDFLRHESVQLAEKRYDRMMKEHETRAKARASFLRREAKGAQKLQAAHKARAERLSRREQNPEAAIEKSRADAQAARAKELEQSAAALLAVAGIGDSKTARAVRAEQQANRAETVRLWSDKDLQGVQAGTPFPIPRKAIAAGKADPMRMREIAAAKQGREVSTPDERAAKQDGVEEQKRKEEKKKTLRALYWAIVNRDQAPVGRLQHDSINREYGLHDSVKEARETLEDTESRRRANHYEQLIEKNDKLAYDYGREEARLQAEGDIAHYEQGRKKEKAEARFNDAVTRARAGKLVGIKRPASVRFKRGDFDQAITDYTTSLKVEFGMPDSAIDGIFESAGEHSRQLISERSEQADRAVKLARSREAEARLDAAKRHEAEQMRKQRPAMEAQRALHEDEELQRRLTVGGDVAGYDAPQ